MKEAEALEPAPSASMAGTAGVEGVDMVPVEGEFGRRKAENWGWAREGEKNKKKRKHESAPCSSAHATPAHSFPQNAGLVGLGRPGEGGRGADQDTQREAACCNQEKEAACVCFFFSAFCSLPYADGLASAEPISSANHARGGGQNSGSLPLR